MDSVHPQYISVVVEQDIDPLLLPDISSPEAVPEALLASSSILTSTCNISLSPATCTTSDHQLIHIILMIATDFG